MELRKATLADAATVAAILTEATQFKLSHGDNAWGSDAYTAEEISGPISKSIVYLVFLNGQAIGTFQLVWQDERIWGTQPPEAGYIHQLAIKNGLHGRGLGKNIIELAAQEAANNGRKFLRLDCPPLNTSLCKYYEELGFKKVGAKEVKYPHGSYAAALYQRQA